MNTAVLSRSVSRRLAAQVDTLGALNAQIAELQGQAELIKAELKSIARESLDSLAPLTAVGEQVAALKETVAALNAELKDCGLNAIEGAVFKCSISVVAQSRLDPDKVKTFLNPAQVLACTRATASIHVNLFDR